MPFTSVSVRVQLGRNIFIALGISNRGNLKQNGTLRGWNCREAKWEGETVTNGRKLLPPSRWRDKEKRWFCGAPELGSPRRAGPGQAGPLGGGSQPQGPSPGRWSRRCCLRQQVSTSFSPPVFHQCCPWAKPRWQVQLLMRVMGSG